jgi:hypothetical protein
MTDPAARHTEGEAGTAEALFTSRREPCEHIRGLMPDEPPYFGHECRECVSVALSAAQAEGERKAYEEAARLAEQPTGHYEIGQSKQPYWDGAKIAAALRARSQR